MEKPILATTLKGVLITHEPWENAHLIWYDDREKELKEKGLSTEDIDKWRQLLKENPEEEKKKYFDFVDGVMQKLYPDSSDEERTKIARGSYFESTIKYIKQNLEVINKDVINYFESLKDKYSLAIISTNTQSALERILKVANIKKDIFDIVEVSRPEEKDKKSDVFDRFTQKHGKPHLYVGAGEEGIEYCKKNNINYIFVDFEGRIDSEETVKTLKELKEKIEKF